MSEFDVRKDVNDITKIRVCGADSTYSVCELIGQYCAGVYIYDGADDVDEGLKVRDREHAENLIKGLQKAIQLNWL